MKIEGSSALQKFKEIINRVIAHFGLRKTEHAPPKRHFSERFKSSVFPSSILARRAERQELSNWMGQLIPNHARINDVVIPGSHDSATSDLDHFRLPMIFQPSAAIKILINRFARTQGRNIGEQLKHGIRFLDLRITSQEHRGFVLHHGAAMGSKIDETMKQIDEFTKAHPKEAVFVKIELDSWMTKEEKDALCLQLTQQFSEKLFPSADTDMRMHPGDITFGQMRQAKRNLMFILEDKGESGDYKPPEAVRDFFWDWNKHISSRWANTADSETLWQRNTEFMNETKDESLMTVSQLQMTAAFNPIKKPLEALRGAWQGLKHLAKQSNKEAVGWLLNRKKSNQPVNVVIMDFAGEKEGEDLIKTTIAMNTTSSPYKAAMSDRDVKTTFRKLGPQLNEIRRKM